MGQAQQPAQQPATVSSTGLHQPPRTAIQAVGGQSTGSSGLGAGSGQTGLHWMGAGFPDNLGFPNTSWPGQAGAGGWQPGSGPGMAQFLDMVVKTVRACDDSDGGNARKRSKKDEVDNNSEEEPLVPVVIPGLDVEDNAVDKICWEIRSRVRSYVGPQAEFWARQPQVVHPLRECYDTSHLRLDPVNAQVTLRDHDRGASRTIKQYLKQNIRVEKTRLSFGGSVDHDVNDVGLRKDYVESTRVYQVISALWQYQSNLWMIRRDDHSGVLLLRLLHDVKFFLPTLLAKFPDKATRDKKQHEVVTYFVDECLRQNSQRGRQGREPLGYEEALRVAKSSLHNIYSGSGVGLVGDYDSDACSFDPYTSGSDGQPGSDGLSRGKRSKKSGGNGSGAGGSGSGSGGSGSGSGGSGSGGSGSGSGGPLPCRDWNVGVCNWSPCKFKHFCNKIVQGGGFCKALHKAKDHK